MTIIVVTVAMRTLAVLVLLATAAWAETTWHYDCRFPGQPRMRIVLREGWKGHTIQFGSGKAVSLEDGGSVGTGMIGHAYDVMRGGKLFAISIPSDRKGYAARLNLWPTAARAGQRGEANIRMGSAVYGSLNPADESRPNPESSE